MHRHIHSVACSLAAATLLTFTMPLSSGAAPVVKSAHTTIVNQLQPQYFTVRYVCFVMQPKKTSIVSREEALARELKAPAALLDLEDGSDRRMSTTPEGFLNGLRAAQTDHNFQLLLSGTVTCINGDNEPAVISDGPNLNDPLKLSVSDSIFLEQNSPVMVTLRHTGKTVHLEGADVATESWHNAHTDKIVIGRTYSQGWTNFLDGRRLVYTFCILPGRPDQTASAWSKAVKALAAQQPKVRTKTAAR